MGDTLVNKYGGETPKIGKTTKRIFRCTGHNIDVKWTYGIRVDFTGIGFDW